VKLQKHQKTLVWVCLAALAVWVIAPARVLLLPLLYFNTYVHELSHAGATLLTGGNVQYLKVFADGSGVTLSQGGNGLLLATAGYVGSAIVGGLLVYCSRTGATAKRMLLISAAFFGFGMLLFVRGDTIGVLAGFGWIAALLAASVFLEGHAAIFAAQFLGVQQCLTSVYAFLALLRVTTNDLGHSDAKIMADMTHIPAVVWSLFWMALGLAAIGIGLHASWKNPPK
jgi:hypothetical protein